MRPTPAQAKVLQGLVDGLTNQEIADRLGISLNTVRVHVERLLLKTGARDRNALVLWALQAGYRAEWHFEFPVPGLSLRQSQILDYLALAYDRGTIAQYLGIKLRTVDYHTGVLKDLLHCETRADLIVAAQGWRSRTRTA